VNVVPSSSVESAVTAPPCALTICRRTFVDALKPRKPGTPLIAIVAINEKTETTDFLVPHALLQRAGVAAVHPVAPRTGRVTLFPTLRVEVPEDFAGFDRAHPYGADYVIVPAMEPDDDPLPPQAGCANRRRRAHA
jgi:putative intracellular protease/amidase